MESKGPRVFFRGPSGDSFRRTSSWKVAPKVSDKQDEVIESKSMDV